MVGKLIFINKKNNELNNSFSHMVSEIILSIVDRFFFVTFISQIFFFYHELVKTIGSIDLVCMVQRLYIEVYK